MTTITAPGTLAVAITREDVEDRTDEGGITWISARAAGGGLVRIWADEDTMRAIVGRLAGCHTATIPIPIGHVEGAV